MSAKASSYFKHLDCFGCFSQEEPEPSVADDKFVLLDVSFETDSRSTRHIEGRPDPSRTQTEASQIGEEPPMAPGSINHPPRARRSTSTPRRHTQRALSRERSHIRSEEARPSGLGAASVSENGPRSRGPRVAAETLVGLLPSDTQADAVSRPPTMIWHSKNEAKYHRSKKTHSDDRHGLQDTAPPGRVHQRSAAPTSHRAAGGGHTVTPKGESLTENKTRQAQTKSSRSDSHARQERRLKYSSRDGHQAEESAASTTPRKSRAVCVSQDRATTSWQSTQVLYVEKEPSRSRTNISKVGGA